MIYTLNPSFACWFVNSNPPLSDFWDYFQLIKAKKYQYKSPLPPLKQHWFFKSKFSGNVIAKTLESVWFSWNLVVQRSSTTNFVNFFLTEEDSGDKTRKTISPAHQQMIPKEGAFDGQGLLALRI